MTIREVIAQLAGSCANLNGGLLVRIVTRDEHGVVVECKEGLVSFVGGIHGYLVVEADSLTEKKS